MKKTAWLAFLALLATESVACRAAGSEIAQGPEIAARFEVLENRPAGGWRARLTLTNQGPVSIVSDGWSLGFSFNRKVEADSIVGGVEIEHVNGDFYRMTPTAAFEPLEPGASRPITFGGPTLLLKECDAPAGPYFVFAGAGGGGEIVRAVTDYSLAPWPVWRGGGSGVPAPAPTAASRYEAERATSALPPAELSPVLPTPRELVRSGGSGSVTLDSSWTIAAEPGLEREARQLAAALEPRLGARPAFAESVTPGPGTVVLRRGTIEAGGAGDAETYRLTIAPGSGIEIAGNAPAGVFYGVQTLLSLLPPPSPDNPSSAGSAGVALDEITIFDRPRFGYRGLHLDVARNFQTRPTVEKLLDVMAFYKLNRLHFHLADDEGWRVAIAGLPELTGVGARRGHTLDDAEHLMPSFGSGPDPDDPASPGNGHYSRDDYMALLRRAAALHIEVVPEIDVPGHARAAIKAMEARAARLEAAGRSKEAARFRLVDPADRSEYRSVQGWSDNVIDVCLESTYRFLDAVFADLVAMHREAGAPLTAIHVGGDEVPGGVWRASPACERLIETDPGIASHEDLAGHFLDRVSTMLSDRGLAMAGWEEIALSGDVHGAGAGKEPNPEFLDRRFRPYVWNNVWGWGAEDLGYRLANAGYEIVLANATNLYFDLAADRDPREPGYTWAGTVDTKKVFAFTPLDVFRSAGENRLGHPLDAGKLYAGRVRPSPEGRERILGIQGQVWGENAKGRDAMEHLTFPKLLALAERAWAPQPVWAREDDPAARERMREEAWNGFANALGQRELPRLDRMAEGFAYRLPPPGAVIEDGVLRANVRFPGLEIRYTTDGGEPTAESTLYEGPVAVTGAVKLRTFDTRGRGSLTTSVP